MPYSISNLFSNSSSNTSFSSLAGLMQDYASIQSGAYKKLLQKHYSNMSSSNTSSSSSKKSTSYTIERRMSDKNSPKSEYTSTTTETTKALKDIRTTANDLKNSATTLSKTGSSVFTPTSIKAEDGNIVREYDTDKIYSAVKNFVDNYNSLLDSTKDSTVSSITSTVTAMKNSTKANESALSDMGISIGKDGKLSIDEDTFKESNMENVKSLFNGANSYAAQTATRATSINTTAQIEQSKANTYTNSGSYSYNYTNGNLYNSYF